jgi:hypothetical protein
VLPEALYPGTKSNRIGSPPDDAAEINVSFFQVSRYGFKYVSGEADPLFTVPDAYEPALATGSVPVPLRIGILLFNHVKLITVPKTGSLNSPSEIFLQVSVQIEICK